MKLEPLLILNQEYLNLVGILETIEQFPSLEELSDFTKLTAASPLIYILHW